MGYSCGVHGLVCTSVHRACTGRAQLYMGRAGGVNGACTGCFKGRSHGIHWPFRGRAQSVHGACTGCACGVHGACTGHGRGMHGVCMSRARCVHGMCIGHAY